MALPRRRHYRSGLVCHCRPGRRPLRTSASVHRDNDRFRRTLSTVGSGNRRNRSAVLACSCSRSDVSQTDSDQYPFPKTSPPAGSKRRSLSGSFGGAGSATGFSQASGFSLGLAGSSYTTSARHGAQNLAGLQHLRRPFWPSRCRSRLRGSNTRRARLNGTGRKRRGAQLRRQSGSRHRRRSTP